ncbi:hypothetical protein CEUSTIGMA_g7029.t1 [Chlamydomonas eustigma]|uniref:AP2/ERF domain-containing protein n=1 Tax=Chlamydomonas eustigma TaxID=1157962 RepID=A0A250X938_9CHLO|nr:hypothetical protein CEUSTIGMA_g7029.t1 [Chlamydomonas eustigma]|eukprot:GAX79588.1 hypothetical protein CEUSTIGMA_g7029.t1 [Chlamydomonas eustigma]
MVGYTYKASIRKFQALIHNLKSAEREQLPNDYKHLTGLSGGYYTSEQEAGKAADKILRKLGRPNNNNLLSESELAEVDATSWTDLMASFRALNKSMATGSCFSKGASTYRGVSWSKAMSKWKANIRASGGTLVFLGYFEEEGEAARVYDQAAWHLHGCTARLNFQEETPPPPPSHILIKLNHSRKGQRHPAAAAGSAKAHTQLGANVADDFKRKTFLQGSAAVASASAAGDSLPEASCSFAHDGKQSTCDEISDISVGHNERINNSIKAAFAVACIPTSGGTVALNGAPEVVEFQNRTMTPQHSTLAAADVGPSIISTTQIESVDYCDSEPEILSGDDFFSDSEEEDEEQCSEQFQQDLVWQTVLNEYYGTDEEVSDYLASEDEDGGTCSDFRPTPEGVPAGVLVRYEAQGRTQNPIEGVFLLGERRVITRDDAIRRREGGHPPDKLSRDPYEFVLMGGGSDTDAPEWRDLLMVILESSAEEEADQTLRNWMKEQFRKSKAEAPEGYWDDEWIEGRKVKKCKLQDFISPILAGSSNKELMNPACRSETSGQLGMMSSSSSALQLLAERLAHNPKLLQRLEAENQKKD